ncbi:HTH-type transcriptional activator AmpR [Roseibium album]|uniref:HTH-type transcriptional activator AmpR n=1 Tax=Roseibium album TaxID=311410 RepID=A0A0M7AKQ3_9HYPH|nr:LysR family glycine cleavage system transcriptional activator [Labrenzia sp. EL_126]CTQ59526.1 HTH-type transcriptional activator AmpR [Roseibium album]CTQ65307.1 HTH-type transcriptional activator AmpR [Roseibium album]CTQ75237.1 HTH-type transcriptional activator AmpR [Roseibium album]
MDWHTLPSLTSLRAFAAAAEYRNLTKAAAALNVTHSAISQQIRGLERRLGTRLVTRTQHGISLTSQGEHLSKGVLEAFAAMAALTETLSNAETMRPILVSATPMFASAFLMPRLSGYMDNNPNIELRIESTIEAVDLKPGGVDLAIRYGTGHWPGLQSQLLLPGCLTVVAARELIGDRTFSDPSDLLDFPLLQEHASVEFDLWLEKVGISPSAKRKVIRLPGNMLLDGIRRGDGIGATVPAFISDELKSGKLVALFDDPIPEIGYYLATLPGTCRPALVHFMRWLSQSTTEYEKTLYRWKTAHLL